MLGLIAAKLAYDTPFRNITIILAKAFPPFVWAWPWLPNDAGSPITVMTSVPFLLAFCLLFVGAYVIGNSRNYFSVITEATRRQKILGLMKDTSISHHNQSINGINAGGDVNINQAADSERKLKEWNNSFWKGPLGGVVIAVIATTVAAVITNAVDLTH